MSDIVASLEAIRDGLKAKIEQLPEVVALKRVEASILEISSVLALVNQAAPSLSTPSLQGENVATPIVAKKVVELAPEHEAVVEEQQDEEEAEDDAQEEHHAIPTSALPHTPAAINEAQFEAELSKLLVHKPA